VVPLFDRLPEVDADHETDWCQVLELLVGHGEMRFSFHTWVERDLTTVEGHLALWKNGVHHRDDASASNLMHDKKDGVTRNEHTGTVPFMARQLLSEKGLAGGIKHVYMHDVESFIWVLMCTNLRYEDGKLREQDRSFDHWLKVNALGCAKKKTFLGTTAGKG
jgi:hypothetical protein